MQTNVHLPKHLPYIKKHTTVIKPRLSKRISIVLSCVSLAFLFTPASLIGVFLLIFVALSHFTSKKTVLSFCPNCFALVRKAVRSGSGSLKCAQCHHRLGIYGEHIVDLDGFPKHGGDNEINVPTTILEAYQSPSTKRNDFVLKASLSWKTPLRLLLLGVIAFLIVCIGFATFSPTSIITPPPVETAQQLQESQEAAQREAERVKVEFLSKRADLMKELREKLKNGKAQEAIALFNSYPSIEDAEFLKLGSKAKAELDKVAAKEQLVQRSAQIIDPVKAFATFLPADEEFYKNNPDTTDIETTRKSLTLFEGLAESLDAAYKAKADMTAEDVAYARGIQKRLIALQVRAFPIIRRAFKSNAGTILWQQDIDVTVSGKGNTTISFAGGTFAANANKQAAQEAISEMLHRMRFKQSRYRWYKGADEYTYYEIASPSDSALATFKFGNFQLLQDRF